MCPTLNFWGLMVSWTHAVTSENLTIYQKGVYYTGIKIYNSLLTAIEDLSGDNSKFKSALNGIAYIKLL
jgi:hypothetical protein